MAYRELIKNFEKIRGYMKDFYVYGFKTRTEYDKKSARSYDDERRRIESWLGEYMRFTMTPDGKTVFLSIDSREAQHNPLYKAWKTKSFTDKDITLHFLLLDILWAEEEPLTLTQILEELDDRLYSLDTDMSFDESTVRKKLQEYTKLGIVRARASGRQMHYCRMPQCDISPLGDLLDYFSETAPCGVIGSFLLDRLDRGRDLFYFKHRYITQTMDSGVLASLFDAMGRKCSITVQNCGKRSAQAQLLHLVPLRVYISAQNGRQHLIAYRRNLGQLTTLRLDSLSQVKLDSPCEQFDALREQLRDAEQHMWGVTGPGGARKLEHVEFDIQAEEWEDHIPQRMEREKRCGKVTRLDQQHYRYQADVWDSNEMLPWIRTFICRITRLEFSNPATARRFREDLTKMYRMYSLEEDAP